jgi:hypothetical protein
MPPVPPSRRSAWRHTVAAILVLAPVVAFVLYSSFRVAAIECEVCMRYDGRELCRSASAARREEALRSAADNACALLTSGMTNTIRCQQTEPARTQCRAASANDSSPTEVSP